MDFKPNEKVVCVLPRYTLVKDEIYSIEEIRICPCGFVMVLVQGVSKTGNGVYTQCKCGKLHKHPDLFGAFRFRKMDHAFADEVIANLKEEVKKKANLLTH